MEFNAQIIEKQQKLFVQGYNLKVHDVFKVHAKTSCSAHAM